MCDIDAERAVIGACLISDRAIETATRTIGAGDFTLERHRQIWNGITAQYATGHRVDTVTLGSELGPEAAQYLHELMVNTPSSSNAGKYAQIIADWSVKREMVHVASRIMDLATGRSASNDAADALDRAKEMLGMLDVPAGTMAPDPDVDSFIASVDISYDWLIPDFLERRDRFLLTASEGAGKSVLLRQIAISAAAGVHPWTRQRVQPVNVSILDMENQKRQIRRAIDKLRPCVPPDFDPQRLRIHSRPAGIDLSSRSDRRWLMDKCLANATELLVIGPLYRMDSGAATRDYEEKAKRITEALDDVRERCGVTLLMETHAPHSKDGMTRDLRPIGSSLWLRWPEFGVGLARKDRDNFDEYEIEMWRGPRDERVWPKELHKKAGRWPWTPMGLPNGTFNNQGRQP